MPLQAARPSPLRSWLLTADARRVIVVADNDRATNGERLNIAPSGKRFRCNFIEPGIVSYTDCGGDVELLRQETIEKALHSALGNPLTIGHVRTNKIVTEAHGRIENVGRDPQSGWFFADGTIETDRARDKIRNNAKPSCGYRVTSFGPGGVYHNIPYAREITGIEFHHLAIVDNPRYEGAGYRLNAKNPPAMKNPFKFIWNIVKPAAEAGGQPVTEAASAEVAPDATVDVGNGKTARLNELVDAFNAPERSNDLSPESEIEYTGADKKVRKVKFLDLVQAHEDRENGVESPAAKTARETLERENSAKEAARKAAEAETERQNAGPKHFRVLSSARNAPVQEPIERANSANSEREQVERGASRYGSTKPGNN